MMNFMTRRDFMGITTTGLGGLWLGYAQKSSASPPSGSTTFESLYTKFQNPDRQHSIRPFWFWNGKLTGDELGRQIRQMVEHGVYGAYAHNRDGLETPYLSEEWWQVVGEALKAARDAGFSLCFVDEFEWPSGEARDYWMPGINKSRVVAANPAFRMQRLHPYEETVQGPGRVEIPIKEGTSLIVAGKRLGANRLDGESLRALPFDRAAQSLSWDVPGGEWLIVTYVLEPTWGLDGGTVDLLNPAATREFIKIYYDEFYRRYGEYFGNAMPAIFSDHEGAYGGQLAWTPSLFEAFRKQKGYDLKPLLPMLTYDAGPRSEKLRCDYQDVISDLYTHNFFRQVCDWCHEHNLEYSGHVWEESLFFGPAYQGDFYRILRAFTNPGCDSLVEWGRQSVWLKEVASVADFEGRRLVCENQGVQGGDSHISPERMRRVSNCLGAWNVGEFVPHAFNYDLNRVNFAPDWFRAQPFLPYFRHYADQLRRISFMNCGSHHVADILLYYPQVSIWGQSAPVYLFQWVPGGVQASSVWSEDANRTNSNYSELKLRLSEQRLDYKVADDSYLAESRVEGGELVISTSRFRTLILPPMSTMRRSTADRIAEFYRGGGTLIAQGFLPLTSVETGRDDPHLKELWDSVFDRAPSLAPFTQRTNDRGGRAYFVRGPVDDVVNLARRIVDHDVDIVSGPADSLFVLHKQKDGVDFYWVVNDAPDARTNLLRFRARGRPERWDAATGRREPVFYQTGEGHTRVRLTLQAWDAAYIAFDPEGSAQHWELSATNLEDFSLVRANSDEALVRGRAMAGKEPLFVELRSKEKILRGSYNPAPSAPIELTGDWTVTVDSATIPLPYCEVKDDPQDRGMQERWFEQDSFLNPWDKLWLSPSNCSIRKWNVIGPFPNPDDRGLEIEFPPEREINFNAVYLGDGEREIGWTGIDSNQERVAPEVAKDWNWAIVPNTGGRYDPRSYAVRHGEILKMGRWPGGTVFAQVNLYVPEALNTVAVLATPCPHAVWMNDRQVRSRWVRPMYFELHDGFAYRIPVRLNQGWNSLLIKFLHNHERPTGSAFTCRLELPEGGPIRGLLADVRQVAQERMKAPWGFRWLRFAVPPVVRAIRVPRLDRAWAVFTDGSPATAGAEIPLSRGTRSVVFRVSSQEVMDQPFEFLTAPSDGSLGTWSIPGLEHFSGSMTYEKQVDIPASLLEERVLLDCGQVGVTAEVWVNGEHAGARPWQPYVFDVTEHLRPGRNRIKVRVANTEGNARAVGESLENLQRIDVNGWLGPARLVPYCEREIRCVSA